MKHYKIILPALLLCLTVSSCQKYLDVKKSSAQIYIETPADCQLVLDNYSIMNSDFPSDGEQSSDDYYLGTNVYNANLAQEEKDLYVWAPKAIRAKADMQWTKPYNAVYFTNLVLETLDKIKGSTDVATYNSLRGSALFLRAFKFWSIAQLYTKPYSSAAAQDPGIPIRTSSDVSDAAGRGTLKETYDKITQDLLEAISLLPVTSTVASRPNKVSAYALLARVYLSMEDYPQALTNADASLKLKSDLLDYNLSTVDKVSTTPFLRFNTEVLFQSLLNANYSVLYAGSVYGPTARVAPDLYNLYDNNDWRKTVFFKAVLTFTSAGAVPDGTYIYTGNYEPAFGPQFFNGLTTSEMYLIRSECYARAGNVSSAMADLNTLLIKRWKNTVTYPTQTATSADDALAKIIKERRKELLMRGLRWTDLRRLNKDTRFAVNLSRTVNEGTPAVATSYTLPANDARYTLLIPQEVVTQTGMQQNPR